eukprot:9503576-Pyramimonas_sp.AAC.1
MGCPKTNQTCAHAHEAIKGMGGLQWTAQAQLVGQARRPEVRDSRGPEGRGRARAAASRTGQERGR